MDNVILWMVILQMWWRISRSTEEVAIVEFLQLWLMREFNEDDKVKHDINRDDVINLPLLHTETNSDFLWFSRPWQSTDLFPSLNFYQQKNHLFDPLTQQITIAFHVLVKLSWLPSTCSCAMLDPFNDQTRPSCVYLVTSKLLIIQFYRVHWSSEYGTHSETFQW